MRVTRGEPTWHHTEEAVEKRVDEFVPGTWWIPGREDLLAEGTVRVFAKGIVWLDVDSDPWRDILSETASTELRRVYGKT